MLKPITLELENLMSFEKEIFEFKQNKAVAIIGENLDDEGQERNGAGKSVILEAISLTLAARTIRDINIRELIREGSNYTRIRITFLNTSTKEEFTIERFFYIKTTESSTCKIWIGDKEVTTCPDINSYNKFILDYIGITAEDLFNFYIITKERYIPFFSTSDSKKKEIINRFSGANIIDGVELFIEKDIKEVDDKISGYNNKISEEEGIKTAYTQNIELVEKTWDKDYIEKEVKRLEEINKSNNNQLLLIKSKINDKTDRCFLLKRKISSSIAIITTTHDSDISVLEKDIKALNEEPKKIRDSYSTKIQAEETKKKTEQGKIKVKETEIETIKKEIQTITQQKTDLENKIEGSIQCPNCFHEFNLQDENFNPDEAVEQVLELDNQISLKEKDISIKEGEITTIKNTTISNIDSTIGTLETERDEKIKENNTSVSTKSESLKSLEEKKRKLEKDEADRKTVILGYNSSFTSFKSEITQLKQSTSLILENIKTTEGLIKTTKNPDKGQVEELKKKIKEAEEKIENHNSEIQKLEEQKQKISEWIFNFKSFKSYLANQSIKNISDYTNYFLNSLNSNISVQVEGYKTLSNQKIREQITTKVFRNGLEKGSYGKFSSGERGRIEICCILAIRELVNLNSNNGGLDLLICDEVLDSVDTKGLELLISALQPLEQTIMIISQQQINASKDQMITVRKENNLSTFN